MSARDGAEKDAQWLTDTQRLTIRNALLASPDLDLSAVEATVASHILSPVVARMLASATCVTPHVPEADA